MNDEIEITPNGPAMDVRVVSATSPTLTPLHGYLAMYDADASTSDRIREVWDYFGDEPIQDKLYEIRKLEDRLAPPKLGGTRLDKLYEYVKLTKEIGQREDERARL